MTKELKIDLAIGGAIAAAFLLAIYFNKKTNEIVQPNKGGKTTNKTDADGNPLFPLKNGSKGDEVLTLQKFLNSSASCQAKAVQVANPLARMKPLFPLDEDGIFGDKTESILTQCFGSPEVSEENFYTMKTTLENKKA